MHCSPLRSYPLVALMVFILPTSLFAIRADYISSKIPDSTDIAPIVRTLKNDIEPRMADFPLITVRQSDRDSMTRLVRAAYIRLNAIKNPDASLKILLLKGLLLLYLGGMGNPVAFNQAIKTLATASQHFPQSREIPWMRGMHSLCSGNIVEGIRVFDSLRVAGFDENEFLSDYAHAVFYAVIPRKSDTFALRLIDPSHGRRGDTASPASFTWTIIESKRAALPFYDYEATFAFRKQFCLEFSGLLPRPPGAALLNYHSIEPPSAISARLIRQLSDRVDSARCAIHIDANDVRISPYEYLLKRIGGIYDSIEVKTDLPAYHAISLRCYSRDFWGREGSCTAYVVFDRSVADLSKIPFVKGIPRLQDVERKIRFTITMRCGIDVWDQAEAKLQSVIRAF